MEDLVARVAVNPATAGLLVVAGALLAFVLILILTLLLLLLLLVPQLPFVLAGPNYKPCEAECRLIGDISGKAIHACQRLWVATHYSRMGHPVTGRVPAQSSR